MKTLDLHGLSTSWAQSVLSSWIKRQHLPCRIIVGNPNGAISIMAKKYLNKHSYTYHHESDWNLGCFIIMSRE